MKRIASFLAALAVLCFGLQPALAAVPPIPPPAVRPILEKQDIGGPVVNSEQIGNQQAARVFRKKLNALRGPASAAVPVKWAWVTSSSGLGIGAGDTVDGNDNGSPNSFPVKAIDYMRGQGIPAIWNSYFATGAQSAIASTLDPNVTIGSGWVAAASTTTFGGPVWNHSTANTNALTFLARYATNDCDLWFSQTGVSVNIEVISDGVVVKSTAITASAGSVLQIDVTPADFTAIGQSAGLHLMGVRKASAVTSGISLIGLACRNTAAPSVELYKGGWSGSIVADWNVATPPRAPLSMLQTLAPDITTFYLTGNDILNNTSVSDFVTGKQALITAAKISGDCFIVGTRPVNTATSAGSLDRQAAFNAADKALAQANNCLFYDLQRKYIDFATAQSDGVFNTDLTHSPKGVHVSDGEGVAKMMMSAQ